jgi:hypothetical protein
MGKLIVDLTGRRFGRLLVRDFAGRNSSGNAKWKCDCDCGNQPVIVGSNFSRRKGNGTKSCGCLKREIMKLHLGADAVRLPHGVASRNAVLSCYRQKARHAGRVWALSDEDFDRTAGGLCYYCGIPPSNETNHPNNNGNFIYNGIDRLNSELGYLLANVVSCCWTCNWMKRNLPPDKFLAHVKQIQAYQDKKTIPCFGEASR